MTGPDHLVLADPQVAFDLRTFVSRARAIDDGAIRLQASDAVLAAFVCPLRPRLLGERTPTVIGMRAMGLGQPTTADVTVSLASVADRLAHLDANDVVLPLPPMTVSESWAGFDLPRGGWEPLAPVRITRLEQVARDGMREVAQIVPAVPGALIVNNARGAVWGRPIEETAAELPAGAAFVAQTMGFLGPAGGYEAKLFRNGSWLRLSTGPGHVLVHRPES